MTEFSPEFISFAKLRMNIQGTLIRQWVNDPSDPVLQDCCQKILAASEVK